MNSAPHGRSSLYYIAMAGHRFVMKLFENLIIEHPHLDAECQERITVPCHL
jgi:hypothetical protein